MGKHLTKSIVLAVCLFFVAGLALAQVTPIGRLIGTVTDPTGAVVAGANVKATDEATGKTYETQSGGDGGFVFSALQAGNYTITVVMQGFKKAEYRAVKIVVGGQHALTTQLEIGEVASTVVIEAGAEVLQTSETKVGTTIMGKSITNLPFTSRDTLDLAVLMPGAQTAGRPRETTFMGLPQGAINITLDGIVDMDQCLKSSDGFFTMIRPRIDTIEEFSISTAAGSASETGEGAVQIRFETKRGGNDFHGGAWWYHRNDKFNSNYYFNNEVAPGQKELTKQRQRLNQFGVKVGGPVIKDKLFFFTAIDFYRNPESRTRTRTILTDESRLGQYRYTAGAFTTAGLPSWMNCGGSYVPGYVGSVPAGTQCVADLMGWGATLVPDPANGFYPSAVFDPFVTSVLDIVQSSLTVPGVSLVATTSLYTRSIGFNNGGGGRRNFPDFRFDYNLTKNHSITAIYHYNYFGGRPDFLNSYDRSYPVEPFSHNDAGQYSNRNSLVGAWRWNIGTTKTNELRVGLVSSPTVWGPDYDLSIYPPFTLMYAAGGSTSMRMRPSFNVISQPWNGYGPSGRNGAVLQVIETFGWSRGKHNFTFGGNWTEVIQKMFWDGAVVGGVSMGFSSDDPMYDDFSSTNFGGAQSTDITNMRSLYSMLTGRVSGFSANALLDLQTKTFGPNIRDLDNVRQTELAGYVTDNWRLFSTLNLNLGVRYEYQGQFRDTLNKYYRVDGYNEGLAGYSCNFDNLFIPTATGCAASMFVLNNGANWWNPDKNNFGPSAGIAWTPNYEGTLYKWIFGGPGKSVFRAGYSISFTREGNNGFFSIAGGNPGSYGDTYSNASGYYSVDPNGYFEPGTVYLSTQTIPNVTIEPPTFGDPFPVEASVGFSVNSYDPNLKTPYVQSWQVGWQREITPSTVFEARYVGTHGTGLWRQYNLNETNIFQPNLTVNGVSVTSFLQEFLNARNNLAICRANQVACRTAAGSSSSTFASFANLGLAGQVPVPIFTGTFTGVMSPAAVAAASTQQRNSNFSSSTWVSTSTGYFALGTAGSAAGYLNSLTRWTNLINSGFPDNFWMFNPDARGGSYAFGNGGHSNYHGLQLEVRRKPSKGLQFNANYTFSKSLTNFFADSSSNYAGYYSLRLPGYDKGPTPWDIRHAFKMQLIYEFPFGEGRRWSSSMGWLNRIIGGWELNTITRWQTGRVSQLTGGLGGTFNGSDGGVELIGITGEELQSMLKIRKTTDGKVYYFPAELIGTDNKANPAYLKSCSTPGEFCQRLFIYGPQFFRADWSIAKRTKLTEKTNIEFRAEFLNAFNNINFFFGGSAAGTSGSSSLQSTSFGRVTNAYQDTSTTDDPGGRIIQMVLRINF